MTEQQQHLAQLAEQQQQLITELNALNAQLTSKREMFLKVSGAIEYLQETGVSLPAPEVTEEEVVEETTEEE